MALLELDDVKVHFGGVRAVDGVTVSVSAGEICGMIGPNGSGKTTTVNAITRSVRVTSGSVAFDGRRIDCLPAHALPRLGLARTFQGIRLVPDLSVYDNVRLAAEQVTHAADDAARRRRAVGLKVDQILERFGLAQVRNHRPTSLAYGTQRRVEIARALAADPKIILLDEPVAGMNRQERAEIAELLDGLRSEGLGLLIIEHDLKMLLELADHLVVLNFGQVLAAGEPHETARLAEVRRAYLGSE